MDMLDFESEGLYFDEPLADEARRCIDRAAEDYAKKLAEEPLLRAYFLEPEHPVVLVALYRYFYYQHRLADALLVAERVMAVFARRLNLPLDWRELHAQNLDERIRNQVTLLRFYLLALKGAGLLELRLGDPESALARLRKVIDLDPIDRLGAQALLDVAHKALKQTTGES